MHAEKDGGFVIRHFLEKKLKKKKNLSHRLQHPATKVSSEAQSMFHIDNETYIKTFWFKHYFENWKTLKTSVIWFVQTNENKYWCYLQKSLLQLLQLLHAYMMTDQLIMKYLCKHLLGCLK